MAARSLLIPRHHFDSTEAKALLRAGQPVVLVNGCPLAAKATDWTFEYLSEKITPEFQCDVFVSDDRRFMYWDGAKNKSNYEFQPPTRKITMPFQQFLETHYTPLRETDVGDDEEEEGKSLGLAAGGGGSGAHVVVPPTPPSPPPPPSTRARAASTTTCSLAWWPRWAAP